MYPVSAVVVAVYMSELSCYNNELDRSVSLHGIAPHICSPVTVGSVAKSCVNVGLVLVRSSWGCFDVEPLGCRRCFTRLAVMGI